TSTVLTVIPLIDILRIASAARAASSGVPASLTPPALPRPPTRTCALTTTARATVRAISAASCGVVAIRPAWSGTPYWARISLDRYSWSFMPSPVRRATARGDAMRAVWRRLILGDRCETADLDWRRTPAL